MAWTSPRTWLAGEDPAASVYNTHIRDQFKMIGDAWTAYTPAWAALTTNPVIGNGTITGAYRQVGKTISFRINITTGSTTTYGTGAYTLTYPPFAPLDSSSVGNPGITGIYRDLNAGNPYGLFAIGNSTTNFLMLMSNTIAFLSATVPVTFQVGDEINIGGTYEAA